MRVRYALHTGAGVEVVAKVWEQKGIVVDATYWPVLIERMPGEFPNDDAAIGAWIAQVEALMREHSSAFVMLVDGLNIKSAPDAQARKRMAEWLSGSLPYQTLCLGVVFVVASPVARGVLTAINWITRPRPPRSTVGTWPEALAECRTMLSGAAIALPSGIAGYIAAKDADASR